MENELSRTFSLDVNAHGVIAAIIEELSAGQCGTESDIEVSPMPSLVKRRAEALRSVSEKTNRGHPGK